MVFIIFSSGNDARRKKGFGARRDGCGRKATNPDPSCHRVVPHSVPTTSLPNPEFISVLFDSNTRLDIF